MAALIIGCLVVFCGLGFALESYDENDDFIP